MTGEYRYQTATPTFLATPRRVRVVVAKAVAHLGVGVGYGLVAVVCAFVAGGTVVLVRGFALGLGTDRALAGGRPRGPRGRAVDAGRARDRDADPQPGRRDARRGRRDLPRRAAGCRSAWTPPTSTDRQVAAEQGLVGDDLARRRVPRAAALVGRGAGAPRLRLVFAGLGVCSPCAATSADRRGRAASEDRNSDVPWSSLTTGRSSARVGPRLTTTTGTPRLAACRTNRKPDITVSDEPSTSSASAAGSRASTAA